MFCKFEDPEIDEHQMRFLLQEITDFVTKGPYCQPGHNVCWFCYTGIGDWEENQADAGHDPSCIYLAYWLMVSYGGQLPVKQTHQAINQ